jgi:hypothetical protein
MKPWHLRISFKLYDSKGRPSDQGTIEQWWAEPMMSKLRVESASYTSTVIENHEGYFQTAGTGPPQQIQAILQIFEYPIPMAEDLSHTEWKLRHDRFEGKSLDCIQQKIATTVVSAATLCLDPATNTLRAINPFTPRSILLNNVESFQGRSVAHSATWKTGDSNTVTAEVTDLSDLSNTDGLFIPSQDMEQTKDIHRSKIIVK